MSKQDPQPPVIEDSVPRKHAQPSLNTEPDLGGAIHTNQPSLSSGPSAQPGERRFARDINAKIDGVESQVEHLKAALARSESGLKDVMGDLKSRTATTTAEIERVEQLLVQSSGEHSDKLAELDVRLRNTADELNTRLASVDEQLRHHHDDIDRLKQDLELSRTRLDGKIEALSDETDRRLDTLARTDEHQQTELNALTEETREGFTRSAQEREALARETRQRLDQLDQSGDQQARELRVLNEETRRGFEHSEQQRESLKQAQEESRLTFNRDIDALREQDQAQNESFSHLSQTVDEHDNRNRRNLRRTAIIGTTAALLFAGSLVYLELTPSAEIERQQVRISGLETQMSTTETRLADAATQQDRLTGTLAGMDGRITRLEDRQETAALLEKEERAVLSENIEDVASRVAAIEESVYGPPATATRNEPVIPIRGADWVSQRDPDHYSIQLLGAYQEQSVIAHTNTHAQALEDHPLSMTQSTYRGQSWHNLFYGDFTSFDDAVTALKALPAEMQENGPWIRSLSSIQSSVE